MRDFMRLIEDRESDRTVPFEEIFDYFKSQGVDIRDYNTSSSHFDAWCKANRISRRKASGNQAIFTRYIEDPLGEDSCPKYFDFWHWLLNVSKDQPFEVNGETRWKIVQLPSADDAIKRASRNLEIYGRIIEIAKAEGQDVRRLPLPSLGQEAAEVLTKIEEHFGKVSILMKVG
jgi:hypothetical protein